MTPHVWKLNLQMLDRMRWILSQMLPCVIYRPTMPPCTVKPSRIHAPFHIAILHAQVSCEF